jgi:hypothetical protein
MHPGRILGVVLGLIILGTIFLIPFVGSQTLYATASPLVSNLSSIQQTGNNAVIASDYITIIVFILLVIAGLVGIFPLGTGVIGVVAMAMFTVGPILIYPSLGTPSYASGFFVVWAASIVSLAASFWHRRSDKTVVVNNQVMVDGSSPSPSSPTPA